MVPTLENRTWSEEEIAADADGETFVKQGPTATAIEKGQFDKLEYYFKLNYARTNTKHYCAVMLDSILNKMNSMQPPALLLYYQALNRTDFVRILKDILKIANLLITNENGTKKITVDVQRKGFAPRGDVELVTAACNLFAGIVVTQSHLEAIDELNNLKHMFNILTIQLYCDFSNFASVAKALHSTGYYSGRTIDLRSPATQVDFVALNFLQMQAALDSLDQIQNLTFNTEKNEWEVSSEGYINRTHFTLHAFKPAYNDLSYAVPDNIFIFARIACETEEIWMPNCVMFLDALGRHFEPPATFGRKFFRLIVETIAIVCSKYKFVHDLEFIKFFKLAQFMQNLINTPVNNQFVLGLTYQRDLFDGICYAVEVLKKEYHDRIVAKHAKLTEAAEKAARELLEQDVIEKEKKQAESEKAAERVEQRRIKREESKAAEAAKMLEEQRVAKAAEEERRVQAELAAAAAAALQAAQRTREHNEALEKRLKEIEATLHQQTLEAIDRRQKIETEKATRQELKRQKREAEFIAEQLEQERIQNEQLLRPGTLCDLEPVIRNLNNLIYDKMPNLEGLKSAIETSNVALFNAFENKTCDSETLKQLTEYIVAANLKIAEIAGEQGSDDPCALETIRANLFFIKERMPKITNGHNIPSSVLQVLNENSKNWKAFLKYSNNKAVQMILAQLTKSRFSLRHYSNDVFGLVKFVRNNDAHSGNLFSAEEYQQCVFIAGITKAIPSFQNSVATLVNFI